MHSSPEMCMSIDERIFMLQDAPSTTITTTTTTSTTSTTTITTALTSQTVVIMREQKTELRVIRGLPPLPPPPPLQPSISYLKQRRSTSRQESTAPEIREAIISDSGSRESGTLTVTKITQQTNQNEKRQQAKGLSVSQSAAKRENNQVQLSATSDPLEEERRLLDESAQLIADDPVEGNSGRSQKSSSARSRRSSAHSISLDSLKQRRGRNQHSLSCHRQCCDTQSSNWQRKKQEVDCSNESDSHDGDEARRLIPSNNCSSFATTTATSTLIANNSTKRLSVHSGCCSRCCLNGDCSCESCTRADRGGVDLDSSSRTRGSGATASMSTRVQTTKLIPAYFVAELIGTFMLVVIGDGAIGAYTLTKRGIDLFCACFGFGVGAMIATFASGKISGAHLNPAASIAFALDGRLLWKLVPVYLVAQYLGGFLAALVLYLNYSEAINALDGGQHSAFGQANSTGGMFATYPAPYLSIWGSLVDQIVGTAVLLFALSAVTDKNNAALEDRHQPLVVAFVIGLTCVAFSPNCGAIFNPARDLSPRLLTAIFGYPAVWAPLDGTYWLLAGIVGPHIGAIIGVFSYKFLIGTALRASERHAESLLAAADLHHTTGFTCDQKHHNNNNNDSLGHRHHHEQQPAQRLSTMARYQMCPNQDRRHVHGPGDYGAAAPTTATTCP